MNRWADGRADRSMYTQMNGCADEQRGREMCGRVNGQTGGWADTRMEW